MTIFRKILILVSATHPKSTHTRRSDLGLKTKIPSDMFDIYCSSTCIQNVGKILTIDLVIAKFKYLTFDPNRGVKGVG